MRYMNKKLVRCCANVGILQHTHPTCLDYYGKWDAIFIGKVGDMAGTVAMMATTERIIRP